jgi:hypothetical protein
VEGYSTLKTEVIFSENVYSAMVSRIICSDVAGGIEQIALFFVNNYLSIFHAYLCLHVSLFF